MTKKLNLGCGEFKKDGYVNVDFHSALEPDVRHDLNEFPYPFSDNEFEVIEADHVLEHLNDVFKVMGELHRISKNRALIIIRVPHFSRGFTHPQHQRGFDVSFPYYFDPSFKGGYQGVALKLKNMKLSWLAQPYLKKTVLSQPYFCLAYLIDSVFSFLANLSPLLCSRMWCFWVGGFEEIEFSFVVIK